MKSVSKLFAGILGSLISIFLSSAIFMWIWNVNITEMFGLPILDYWDALVIVFLFWVLDTKVK